MAGGTFISGPSSSTPDPLARARCAVGVLIFLITFAAFIPALGAGFSDYDDHGVLLEVTGWRGLAPANFAWDFTTTNMGHYEPLTYLSFGIEYSLWGLQSAWGYHLTSVLVHCISAVLLYVLAMRLMVAASLRDPRAAPVPAMLAPAGMPIMLGAAAAALFWSVHPLRVESVAWLTERRDVLSGCFLLLATLAYLRAFPPASVRPVSREWYWTSAALLVLSLFCKAWGMTYFVVLFVLDLYPLRRLPASRPWHWPRREFRPVLWQKLPFAVPGLIFAAAAAYAQSSSLATVRPLSQWGVAERLSQAAYGLMFYLWKTVVPTSLAALYELPIKLSPSEPRILAACGVLTALVVVALALRNKAPGVPAALAVYAVTVAPVLGLLQSGTQMVADRYSYVCTMGIAVLVGGGVAALLRPRGAERPRIRSGAAIALGAVAGVVVGTFTVLSWRQERLWYNSEQLFAHVLETGWDGPVTRAQLGRLIEERSKEPDCPNARELKERAREQYRAALSLDPTDGQAWYTLGNVERDLGRPTEARSAYLEAVKSMPEPWRAWVGLGLLDLRENRAAHAQQLFEAAVADVERPDRLRGSTPGGGGLPYFWLAATLDMNGDPKASREMLLKAAQYDQVRETALERLKEVDEELRGK